MNDLVGKKRTPEQEELFWAYWHKLRDIREQRALTEGEQLKYDAYLAIVARLDKEEEDRCFEHYEKIGSPLFDMKGLRDDTQSDSLGQEKLLNAAALKRLSALGLNPDVSFEAHGK